MMSADDHARASPSGAWRTHAALALAGALLVAALALGGDAQGNGDALVHVVAALAMGAAIVRWDMPPLDALQKTTFGLLLASVAVAAMQLVPLPSGVFGQLPGRRLVLDELRAVGLEPARLAMSLDPGGTRRALLSLATFLSMWMLCTTLETAARVRLLKLAAAIAVPMALLGYAQASRKLDTTGANGLFENRNHYATLMAMMLPVALAAAREAVERRRTWQVFAWYAASAAILLAAALSFSRMGFLLALLSAVASFVLLTPRGRGLLPRRGALASLALAAVAVTWFARARLAARFGADVTTDLRWQYFENGWVALKAYWPWGSGLGSFRQVYAQFEPFAALAEFTFANHAHNDLLQNAIEAGLAGLGLMLAFVAVIVVAAKRVLSGRGGWDGWQRAALVTAVVPLIHSLVDYPLRTFACSVPLALALATLLSPARSARGSRAKRAVISTGDGTLP